MNNGSELELRLELELELGSGLGLGLGSGIGLGLGLGPRRTTPPRIKGRYHTYCRMRYVSYQLVKIVAALFSVTRLATTCVRNRRINKCKG